MNVERQFKLRGIPFTHVNPTSGVPVTTELAHIQSSLARSVPALCVQSKHILSGAPAAEAAMPNIRVIPLNWWSDKNAQVSGSEETLHHSTDCSYCLGSDMCEAEICATANGQDRWHKRCHSTIQTDYIRHHRSRCFVFV